MQADPDAGVVLKLVKQRKVGFCECFLVEMVKIADGLMIMDAEQKIDFFHADRPGKAAVSGLKNRRSCLAGFFLAFLFFLTCNAQRGYRPYLKPAGADFASAFFTNAERTVFDPLHGFFNF